MSTHSNEASVAAREGSKEGVTGEVGVEQIPMERIGFTRKKMS